MDLENSRLSSVSHLQETHRTFFQTLVNKTINPPLHISSSVVNSRVCKVMIVGYHPSDSMRTSAKALRMLFCPWTQQVALSCFLELLIQTASDCKPGSTAAQQAAGWWKRTAVIAITVPRGVNDTHEPMRGRCSAGICVWKNTCGAVILDLLNRSPSSLVCVHILTWLVPIACLQTAFVI